MNKYKPKQIDRVILFEIGVILALLMINWVMNMEYRSSFDVIGDSTEKEWDSLIVLPPEPQIEQEKTQQKAAFIPFNPISVIKQVDDLFKVNDISKIDIKPKAPGPIKNIPFISRASSSAKIDSFAAVMPQYPGGHEALSKFIQDRFNFTDRMYDYGGSVRVIVQFVVRKDGEVTDIEVLNCSVPHLGIQQEAVILCNKMPKWIPGNDGNQPVNVRMILPLTIQVY